MSAEGEHFGRAFEEDGMQFHFGKFWPKFIKLPKLYKSEQLLGRKTGILSSNATLNRGHGLVPEHRRLDPHDRISLSSTLRARFKPNPHGFRLFFIRGESPHGDRTRLPTI
jgi:hypothetical protein